MCIRIPAQWKRFCSLAKMISEELTIWLHFKAFLDLLESTFIVFQTSNSHMQLIQRGSGSWICWVWCWDDWKEERKKKEEYSHLNYFQSHYYVTPGQVKYGAGLLHSLNLPFKACSLNVLKQCTFVVFEKEKTMHLFYLRCRLLAWRLYVFPLLKQPGSNPFQEKKYFFCLATDITN